MITALAVVLAAAPWPAEAGEETEAQKAEIERLRREMESAYLDVQRDHARVRAAEWSEVQLPQEFAALLESLVKDARSQTAAASGVESEAAAAAVRAIEERHVDAPL